LLTTSTTEPTTRIATTTTPSESLVHCFD
jgi:hypothetical protein